MIRGVRVVIWVVTRATVRHEWLLMAPHSESTAYSYAKMRKTAERHTEINIRFCIMVFVTHVDVG